MHFPIASFVILSLSSYVLAVPYLTNPIATTTFQAGTQATITWQDDGKAPTLQDFGDCKISIYVGNAQQQTSLQLISQTNVAATNSVTFSPDPTVGENSDQYFIRIESLNFKDPNAPQYPALAFSAKFTMSGMTGAFTADAKKQIAGQSTAPLGGAAPPAGSPPAGSAPANSSPAPSKPQSSSSSPSGAKLASSPSPSAGHNGASAYAVSGKVVLGSLLAAAVALF